MMSQMESSEQQQGQYGNYAGYPGYQGYQQYGEAISDGPSSPGNMYDDAFIDAMAQRLSQRMVQGPAGKLKPEAKGRVSPQQRLALAIVSVIMIAVFTTGIVTSTGAALGGLIAVGLMCLAIFLINAVFNYS